MNKPASIICHLLVTATLLLFSTYLYATDKQYGRTINILTWWGYLNYPELIKKAEKECGVNISFDEYYSNDEFLRRWEGQKDFYDIIIFSDTIYNFVKHKLPKIKNNNLYKQSLNYNHIIKQHYDNKEYPHNVVYFLQGLTGFLWNPDNLTLTQNDTITSIFNKARDKFVVIIDDPVEAWKLIEAGFNDHSREIHFNDFTIKNFNNLIQNSNVYIANNYRKIYKKSEFAFSFSWSGESVVSALESNKHYQFLVHPKFSYISSDLLAQTSIDMKSYCVSRFLTNKKTSAFFQNNNFYFSPYNQDNMIIKNASFKKIYMNYLKLLPSLAWTDSISANNLEKLNRSWQLIKLSLNNHSGGN